MNNLYQRVNGKNITGQYVLQETEAPAGFSNNKEEIKFVVFENEENSLEVAFENDEYETLASAEFEGDTLVDERKNDDWSREIQVYKKVGVGAVITNNICVYRNTSLTK